MKLRTTKYLIKEGLVNVSRHWLMSIASIVVIIASLLIFGAFYVVIYNLNINTNVLQDQPHVIMWVDENLADFEIEEIGEYLDGSTYVDKYEYISREEALERAKEMLGENSDVFDLVEGLEEDIFRPGYMVELANPENSEEFVEEVSGVYGVAEVEYSQKWISFIISISKWIKWISGIFVIIFVVVAVLIISNTIKLTVYARRKEINIMKYIGASDWFIRWPFVIEGLVIGIIGSLIALIATTVAYNYLAEYSAGFMTSMAGQLQLASVKEMALNLALYYSMLGVLVGVLGSALSMRKYLRV